MRDLLEEGRKEVRQWQEQNRVAGKFCPACDKPKRPTAEHCPRCQEELDAEIERLKALVRYPESEKLKEARRLIRLTLGLLAAYVVGASLLVWWVS